MLGKEEVKKKVEQLPPPIFENEGLDLNFDEDWSSGLPPAKEIKKVSEQNMNEDPE